MPKDLREAWVAEGKLSPYASVDVYAGPRGYASLFPTTESERWPPMMNLLERPTVWAPNYDHWYFLEVNPRRRDDVLYYLKERPLEYAGSVAENLKQMFGPSTKWHAPDKPERSPHQQHRKVLGGYEALYNGVVHGFPSPVGLYLLAPLALGWGIVRARSLAKDETPDAAARAALFVFSAIQIVFVVLAGIFVAFGEAPHHRYEVEALIWLFAALAIADTASAPIRKMKASIWKR
jgi:hypothetical protein